MPARRTIIAHGSDFRPSGNVFQTFSASAISSVAGACPQRSLK
jgi:hypothetical protein